MLELYRVPREQALRLTIEELSGPGNPLVTIAGALAKGHGRGRAAVRVGGPPPDRRLHLPRRSLPEAGGAGRPAVHHGDGAGHRPAQAGGGGKAAAGAVHRAAAGVHGRGHRRGGHRRPVHDHQQVGTADDRLYDRRDHGQTHARPDPLQENGRDAVPPGRLLHLPVRQDRGGLPGEQRRVLEEGRHLVPGRVFVLSHRRERDHQRLGRRSSPTSRSACGRNRRYRMRGCRPRCTSTSWATTSTT